MLIVQHIGTRGFYTLRYGDVIFSYCLRTIKFNPYACTISSAYKPNDLYDTRYFKIYKPITNRLRELFK